jgi:hypothetical protein
MAENPQIGFVAYASQPAWLGETIEAGLERYAQQRGKGKFASWAENDIAGRFLADPILERIEAGKCLVADISSLNFNVTYEIGYAIAKGKRVVLVRNRAHQADEAELRRVGIFDTLGFRSYENGDELAALLRNIQDFDGLPVPATVDPTTPVWMLQFPFNTEVQGRLIARLKKARLRFRSFDPSEQSRLAANDAIESVATAYGTVIPLATKDTVDARIHNLRAAFAAGLSHGLGKSTLLLQSGDDPVPLDYRDLVQHFRHAKQIDEYVAQLALDVTEKLQSVVPIVPERGGLLFRLDMGSSTAENEFTHLGSYYLQTDEFRRALRGEVRIVTGRKGAGKTAVFAQVRDHVRSDRQNIVIDLKPEGYQLRKFKDQILDFLEEGTAEHTITAFWEYLLLLEIVYKVLEKDHALHLRDHRLLEPYQRLSAAYSSEEYVREGDFSERMLRLVDSIAAVFKDKYKSQTDIRLNQRQVTELLYLHNLRELREALESYLQFKGEVWILFDNLDKGWSTHGVSDADLLMMRSLLDASRKLEQSFTAQDIDCHTIVFMRNDIYQLLIDHTSDRGKELRTSLDWSEPDLLRQLLKRRLLYNELPDQPFEQLWRQISVPFVDGEESSQFLIDRSLMRPRFLLNALSHCRGFALNLEHERIEEEDIQRGISAYSTDLIYDIDLEIRDVLPFAEDVLYNFLGSPSNLSVERINQVLTEAGFDEKQREALFEIFLWYGVLGVMRDDGEAAYIYNVNYDVRRLKILIGRVESSADRIAINPAFWSGLEVEPG